ncbi:17156_t:CDS:2 [Cetraspora pellucida]|uniref:17156_t:CDS:1 n=1 Tax=Cetraspora pellucida TaxID=1433469 RepID=A0A9N9NID7_9GLOM|nr:17156_t:CDS:2 [Cetraspora pellucida]
MNNESQEESDDDINDMDLIEVTSNINIKFAEDYYESIISNLNFLIKYIDRTSFYEVWCVTTIEQNKTYFVIVYGTANHLCTYMNLVTKGNEDSNEFRFEHQIEVKYNKEFEYTKKAVNLSLEISYENELNKILQDWIKKKEKIYNNINEFNKENLPDISNSYLMQTKDAPKKCIKSMLENKTSKCYNKKTDKPVYVSKVKCCTTTKDL